MVVIVGTESLIIFAKRCNESVLDISEIVEKMYEMTY